MSGQAVMSVEGKEFRGWGSRPEGMFNSTDTLFPNLSTSGLSVKKSKIQLQIEVGSPRSASFATALLGWTVNKLNYIPEKK